MSKSLVMKLRLDITIILEGALFKLRMAEENRIGTIVQ